MREILVAILLIFSGAHAAGKHARCQGCSIGKEKLQCDYYVARNAEPAHRQECRTYAAYVDIDGAYPKAAWYYLLAGVPDRASAAARKALKQGQLYGREYLATALWVQGRREEAKKEMKRFLREVPEHDYLGRDLKTLERLYPGKGLSELGE